MDECGGVNYAGEDKGGYGRISSLEMSGEAKKKAGIQDIFAGKSRDGEDKGGDYWLSSLE